MGRIFDQTDYRSINDDERWYFHLEIYTDPATGPVSVIRRQVREDGHWQNEGSPIYAREFDRESFSEHHYKNFRAKFARDAAYREKWIED